jgi:hypothetical protein
MAVSTTNIFQGAPDRVTGAVMVAPVGTTLPTDTVGAPNGAFTDLGYISEDGVTLSQNTSWEQIKDWGGDIVASLMTEFSGTLKFTCLETNATTLKATYGSSNVSVVAATVSTGTEITTKLNASQSPDNAWLFNVKAGSSKVRVVVPDGVITDRGDISLVRKDVIKYDLTVECHPDSAGDSIKLITNDGVTSTSALPGIAGLNQATGTAGNIIIITGVRFTGVTAVTFGVTPAADFEYLNSTTIVATVAGTAGATTITVTTPAGVSATFPFTRT